MERPNDCSPEWNDYVLSLMQPDECLDGKHPFTKSLRRVAEQLIGTIIYSAPEEVFFKTAKDERYEKTVVRYKIIFLDPDGRERTFGDVADVSILNTEALFLAYSTATACTIAEGRTLRKALKLKALAAEEIMGKDAKSVESSVSNATADNIQDAQIKFIDKQCVNLDIDVMKFVNSGKEQYSTILDVSRETAKKMVQQLNKFTNGADVPDELKGYQPWQ